MTNNKINCLYSSITGIESETVFKRDSPWTNGKTFPLLKSRQKIQQETPILNYQWAATLLWENTNSNPSGKMYSQNSKIVLVGNTSALSFKS